MQKQKRIKSIANFQKRRDLMKQQLKRAEEKLQALENKRAIELGRLAIECGLAEKNNHYLEQAFLKLAKEDFHG